MNIVPQPLGKTPPRLISSVIIDIFARSGSEYLDPQPAKQLHDLAATRAEDRMTDQNKWLRSVWKHLLRTGKVPCWTDCWVPERKYSDPPSTIRQTIAEVLGHPKFHPTVDEATLVWAIHTARSLHPSKKIVMCVRYRELFASLWKFLYKNGPSVSVKDF